MFWLCPTFACLVQLIPSLPMMHSLHACASVAPLVRFGLATLYALSMQERKWHPKVDLASITLEQLRRAVATVQASAQAADEAAKSQQVNKWKGCSGQVMRNSCHAWPCLTAG